MKRHIVFITDCSDVAHNELRAATLSELNKLGKGHLIEIEPAVIAKPFSLINGSFLLRLMAESYPDDTVFSVILNPSKVRPERLFGRTKSKNFLFVGTNTGVLEWFLRDFGTKELYELIDPGFVSFGGKYIHAPAVAWIANGAEFSKLGIPFPHSKLNKLSMLPGVVLHVDNFGLIKFNTHLEKMSEGQTVSVRIKNHSISAVYAKRMMSCETGEWVVYNGSSLGLAELGKVRQNGAEELGVKEGDTIVISENLC